MEDAASEVNRVRAFPALCHAASPSVAPQPNRSTDMLGAPSAKLRSHGAKLDLRRQGREPGVWRVDPRRFRAADRRGHVLPRSGCSRWPRRRGRTTTAEFQTAQSRGWDTLDNGALLNAAEEAGFAVLLTTDRRIRYQQNLASRRISLVVLTGSTRWSRVRHHADRIAAAVASATPGSYSEVEIPFDR